MRYAKKSLGQNFLIDKNIIKKIVNLSNIKDKNIILRRNTKFTLTEWKKRSGKDSFDLPKNLFFLSAKVL